MAPSRATPSTVPRIVPLPPVIAVPPTTTAAIVFISRPRPVLLGIWLNRAALSNAARPVSAPFRVKTQKIIRCVSSPASRAASGFEPAA